MAAAIVQPLTRPRVGMLIASPDSQFRRRCLEEAGEYDKPNHEVEGGAHALAKLSECDCDRVILDRRLPDLDASEVAGFIRQRYPRTAIEMVDSRKDVPVAMENEIPAHDCCEPQQKSNSLRAAGIELRTELRIEDQSERATVRERCAEALPGMIGTSAVMREMYHLIRLVAPRDTTILLTGETGTGEELVAHAIHQLSSRAKNAFVAVNCAAIPEALLESELFGHVRGA